MFLDGELSNDLRGIRDEQWKRIAKSSHVVGPRLLSMTRDYFALASARQLSGGTSSLSQRRFPRPPAPNPEWVTKARAPQTSDPAGIG